MLLNSFPVCAANFDIFPVGRIKHGLVVDEKGRIVQDGVLVRTAEDEVMTYWMVPMLNYYLDTKKFGDFDVTGEIMTGKVFLFQIGGPVSIDIVERASGMDLRELKFLRSVESTIAGKPVCILRIGMACILWSRKEKEKDSGQISFAGVKGCQGKDGK